MNQEVSAVSDLGNAMKVVLADSFGMMLQSLHYHWNVEGRDFFSLHQMFQTIYEDLFASIDTTAEHIRALDEYCPGTYKRFQELQTLEEDSKIPTASAMVERLLATNDRVIKSIQTALEQAKIAGDSGIENYLGGRLEIHTKHGWFLRATGKKNRE